MAVVTISSGVHVGTRNDATAFITWFAGSTTTQFSPFSLTSASAIPSARTGPQVISGHASLAGSPIEFTVERRTRDVVTDSLAAVVVVDLVGGAPRTNLGGFRDAVARSGRLVNVAWSERRNDGGAAEAFSVWGVLVLVDSSVRGLTESLRLVLWPCDALGLIAGAWYLSPVAYAELDV